MSSAADVEVPVGDGTDPALRGAALDEAVARARAGAGAVAVVPV